MPTTLPNLPNLAGTNVTPNVPAHVLSDTDITIVNSSTTLGIGADRKVTLGELKSSIVTPITNPIAETVSAITSKAILVDLKDANGTTGVYPLDMAGYACDLHVLVVNSTSVAPPVSPGYFTLQIANALPAGATIHISGAVGGTVGTTLPVRVHFTSSYNQGLGETLYPSPAFIPLINGGHLSAVVAYDGVTWRVDSTDIIAMAAYKLPFQRSGSLSVRAENTPLGYYEIPNGTETVLAGTSGSTSATPIMLSSGGAWAIDLFLTFRTTWTGGGSGESDHETLAQIYLLDSDGHQAGPKLDGLRTYVNSTIGQTYVTKSGSIKSVFTDRQALGMQVVGKFPIAHDANTKLDLLDLRASWYKL